MASTQGRAVERLVNLSFALQGAAHAASPNKPEDAARSAEWIRSNVAGYQDKSDEAFAKALRRDVRALQRAGVPIVSTSAAGFGAEYRLLDESYELPAMHFTPEEALVLGLAASIGEGGGMNDLSQSGWTKIAASGATRDLAARPTVTAVADAQRVDPEVVRAILTIVRNGYRMRFDYQRGPGVEPTSRTMDPWGLVTHRTRLYLVGWDVDRDAPRAFRATRLSKVRASRTPAERLEPTAPLQEIVEEALSMEGVVDALVDAPEGTARDLVSQGTRRPDGLVELEKVPLDWLVRVAAGYADEAEVLEPTEARKRIVTLLKTAAQQVKDEDAADE